MIQKVVLDSFDNVFTESWVKEVTEDFNEQDTELFKKALEWTTPFLVNRLRYTQEPCIRHAKGLIKILALLQLDVTTFIAAIFATIPGSQFTQEELWKMRDEALHLFGVEVMSLLSGDRTLVRIGAQAVLSKEVSEDQKANQQEMLRKMLLAMATDLRIVMIRLASRLQTLRWYSDSKMVCPHELAQQTSDIYAPLANRLGIWQIKWEMEDLAFRALHPLVYREIANKLEVTRVERESMVNHFMTTLKEYLDDIHVKAQVSGRAKHIYSIYNKMKNKNLRFEQLYDLQAIRVITQSERDCYAVLAMVHSRWNPLMDEFDDYIARPKPNGYRSLHTVVIDDFGNYFEVQIRTEQMHQFAEYGMAAHWRYKESGAKGGQTTASSLYDRQISWMRQLLAWRREVGMSEKEAEQGLSEVAQDAKDQQTPLQALGEKLVKTQTPKSDRIYVLTPQARVIELHEGSTPVDFAYYLHTDLGHRCRGAKVDGQLVALNTPLKTGQTVEIITAKSGGPSRDWLNPQLGYLKSPRSKAKVRLWFNAIELQQRINHGQELVEKELQRLGKTAVNLEHLAEKLGFSRLDDLYVAVAKDEFSLRSIANAFVQATPEPKEENKINLVQRTSSTSATKTGKSGVLVVGVDALLTQLARCCHPAPPDAISGFVTRGKGVSIHRSNCPSFKVMQQKHPERVIEVGWGESSDTVFPVTILVVANDRKSLLRDVIEHFSKLKINVVGANTQTRQSMAHMSFTIEVQNGDQITKALAVLREIPDVIDVKRQ